MNEFELRRSLSELPRSRTPARDLWPAVDARIGSPVTQSPASRWHWLALAAAALLAVALLPQQLGDRVDPLAPGDQQTASAAAAPRGEPLLVGSAWVFPAWVLDDADVSAALLELEESNAELHQLIRDNPAATHLLPLLHANYEQQRWLTRFGVGQGLPQVPQET